MYSGKRIPFNVSLKEAAEADRHFKTIRTFKNNGFSYRFVSPGNSCSAEMPSITGLDLSGKCQGTFTNTLIQWNYYR